MLARHLGGHLGITHVDHGALRAMVDATGPAAMLDIGCGPGGMLDVAREFGLVAAGIDGDATLPQRAGVTVHDFTHGKPPPEAIPNERPLLGWSVEFVEHVEQCYVPNFMSAFAACTHVVLTHAPPGMPGHHHVNCQTEHYWRSVFAAYSLSVDNQLTQKVRAASTMQRDFIRQRGLVFRKVWK